MPHAFNFTSRPGLDIKQPVQFLSYTHIYTHTEAERKDASNNAYPMKLLKATQARRKDRTDKGSEKETER